MHRLLYLTVAASLLFLPSLAAAQPADAPALPQAVSGQDRPIARRAAARQERRAKLIEAVSGQDRAARLQAIDELGKLGSEAKPAVAALMQALAGDDEELGSRAARTLGAVGPDAEQAVPALIEALQSDKPKVRAYAAFALGRIGKAAGDAAEMLAKAAFDEDTLVRRAALQALRQIDAPKEKTRPVIKKILKEGDTQIIMPALRTLAEQYEEGVPHLREALKDNDICYWACIVVSDIGADAAAAVPEVTELLKQEDPDIRMHALIALGEIGEASGASLPAIIEKLKNDEYEAVRFAAAFALGKIKQQDDEAILELVAAARDGEPLLKVMSYWALARLRPDRTDVVRGAAQKIAEALTSENANLRTVAAQALVELDAAPEIVRPVMLKALQDADPRVVGKAMDALAALGPEALEDIGDVLADPMARHYATLIIYRMGPKAAPAVPALVAALSAAGDTEDDLAFCREAQMALAAIGPGADAAVAVLIDSLGCDNKEVHGSACYALGKIGPAAAAAVQKLQETAQQLDEDSGKIGCVWALLKIQPDLESLAEMAVPVLAKGLDNLDDLVRTEAAAALGEIGKPASTPEVIDRLKLLLQDESDQVREAATGALEKLE